MVYRPGTPHLYTFKQYEVATSQVLGSLGHLNADVSAGDADPASSPLSPRSMIHRAKALLDSRSNVMLETAENEKVHGTFCRTKSVVKRSLRRSKDGGAATLGPPGSLRSGYLSASDKVLISEATDEKFVESESSTVSDDAPQIPPLRPLSKFMPALTISIPENELSGIVVAEHFSIGNQSEDDGTDSEFESSCGASLPWLSDSTVESKNDDNLRETPFCNLKEDDDVFVPSHETSQNDSPMTNFMTRLRDTMEPKCRYKPTSAAVTAISASITLTTPSKLRHTALQKTPGLNSASLRTRFAAFEPASSPVTLDVPKVWTMNEIEMNKSVRLAPSLEEGLSAVHLEVFEENTVAAAAPVIRGVKPDVVVIQGSQMIETFVRQDPAASDQHIPLDGPADGSVLPDPVFPSCKMSAATSHGSEPSDSLKVPKIPLQVLQTIVFSAAYGDAQCRALALCLYDELLQETIAVTEPRFDAQGQRLLLQSNLMRELDSSTRLGCLQHDVFKTIRGQLFPTRDTVMMEPRAFTAYIHRAVDASHISEHWAKEVLGFVVGDEAFAQCSPEEEVFFERQPFDSEGFVYGHDANTGPYEHLDSLRSTISTIKSAEPRQQPGRRSSFLSKVIHMFRPGQWKRPS